jgi:hypothetical protein
MHQNALHVPLIPPDEKHEFGVMCPGVLFKTPH